MTTPVPALADDRAAFVVLMQRHNRRLYRLARAILRDGAEAEDALQEAYLMAYRSIGQFRGEASLATWLARLVHNECLGRLRRQSRRQTIVPIVPQPSGFEGEPSSEELSPERTFGRAEMRAVLERKVDELPDAFRSVFVLRSVEDLSVEETARCLDISEATVRSRHFRAKSLLRDSLAREIDLAERDVFAFGGSDCERIVAKVLARLDGG